MWNAQQSESYGIQKPGKSPSDNHCRGGVVVYKVSRAALATIALLNLSLLAFSTARVVVDHNSVSTANKGFRFKNVPSPVRDNAAAKARISLVVGRPDPSSGGLSVLTDGALPTHEDEPRANFFFDAGSDGGRILMDFGVAVDVTQVNTYSWHANSRGPQVYNLYASDGRDPKFKAQPDARTDPVACGWSLIARVDTRPRQGDGGGQYGVSISDPPGILGKYRYLLFDSVPTEIDDPWGNTFYSEIIVVTTPAVPPIMHIP